MASREIQEDQDRRHPADHEPTTHPSTLVTMCATARQSHHHLTLFSLVRFVLMHRKCPSTAPHHPSIDAMESLRELSSKASRHKKPKNDKLTVGTRAGRVADARNCGARTHIGRSRHRSHCPDSSTESRCAADGPRTARNGSCGWLAAISSSRLPCSNELAFFVRSSHGVSLASVAGRTELSGKIAVVLVWFSAG